MPRGIPNARRDETGMRYTTFHVPLAPNPKQLGTTYLKSDSQTIWSRNTSKRSKLATDETPTPAAQDQKRGSQVIVIHFGSRILRVGRACDVNPVAVPNVVARKSKPPVPEPVFVEGISRPRTGQYSPQKVNSSQNGDEYAVPLNSDDPFDAKFAALTVSLRDRMRFYKLRVTPNAAGIASTFNDQFQPEKIQEYNDPFRVDWITSDDDEVIIGEKALCIADPHSQGYIVRWPIHAHNFNARSYPSAQLIYNDIEAVLRQTLIDKFNLNPSDYKNYSVVLLIPDLYERAYVRGLVDLVLVSMGFKQICVQQESLAATYGAGISNACVIDIGASVTTVACVDEGLVIADTRMTLNMGGDDVTESLYVMLQRISFPYRDLNLARWYDWGVMEDLKSRICTLAEGDVALNLYDFVVRKPGMPAEKYGLRAYDEIILAPMCLFEPRIIDFDRKRIGCRTRAQPDISEEIIEHTTDHITQAMVISTQHLIPPLVPSEVELVPSADIEKKPVSPVPQLTLESSAAAESAGSLKNKEPPATTADNDKVSPPAADLREVGDIPMEIIDIDGENVKTSTSVPATAPQPVIGGVALSPDDHAFTIDVCFEASKLPLDVAIFNSARAAGGDEKIRKYLQAVLVIGGTALVPGMAHALESRSAQNLKLQAIATPLVPNMEKVQIIPPPKDVDPRVLAWKGAAVLGKMDGVADLWVTAADWNILGMRGLKERCFYI